MSLILGLCIGLWPCDMGYSGHGVMNCEDIDECVDISLNHCHEDALCINTIGSWECACSVGHEGSGQDCADLNECVLGMSFKWKLSTE